MNYTELLSELRQFDETTLLELLEITSDQIVDAFIDEIDEKQNMLLKYVRENR